MSQKRINVVPSRGVNQMLKARLSSAQKGHSLLKRKSDALRNRFNVILKGTIEIKPQMVQVLRDAYFSLAELSFVAGNINNYVLENVEKSRVRITRKKENVAGISFNSFEATVDGKDPFELLCLSKGGQELAKLKETFISAIRILVKLASLQSAFLTLDEVIRATNRRVNALDHIIVPIFQNTISYVLSELEESEREDFYRIKKIQDKKKEHKLKLEAIQEEKKVAEEKDQNLVGGGDIKNAVFLYGLK